MPICAMIARMMSLAVTPGCSRPSTVTASVFGRLLQQALRRQHVRHLAGADAERQRAERAVGAGVAVAADDRHARLGQPQLRPDDVHDALPLVAQRVQLDAELGAVLLQLPRSASPPRDRASESARRRRAAWSASSDPSSPPSAPGGAPSAALAQPVNACGEVTSWIRCRSMYSTAGVSAVCGRTRWASQIFSNSVRGFMRLASLWPPGPAARPVTTPAAFVKFSLHDGRRPVPALHDALVVAQTGSVGEAARRLHKTASAVSQQLRRIEAALRRRVVREGGPRRAAERGGRGGLGASRASSTRRRRWRALLAELAGERGDHAAGRRQRLPG